MHWSNRIAERTKDVTEQCRGSSHLQDKISRSDHGGGSDRSKDKEDVDMNTTVDEDEVFTLPHIFHTESVRSPRTKFGQILAEIPAKFENPSPNLVRGQS